MVAADDTAVCGHDRTGLRRHVLAQELAEASLADEADAGGIFFLVSDEAGDMRACAHLAFLDATYRKQRVRELLLPEGIQEITLVLVLIDAGLQTPAVAVVTTLHIMSGRNQVAADGARCGQESLELDLTVAQHIGIGRATAPVFGEEILEHAVPIGLRKINGVERYVELLAHRQAVVDVLFPAAVAVLGGLVPVLHEQGRAA